MDNEKVQNGYLEKYLVKKNMMTEAEVEDNIEEICESNTEQEC